MTGASVIFFFNDTATTEIYTLSLHDALPIGPAAGPRGTAHRPDPPRAAPARPHPGRRPGHRGQTRHLHRVRPRGDRKSTRLNSSHANISYAVFCLKKKKYTSSSLLSPNVIIC